MNRATTLREVDNVTIVALSGKFTLGDAPGVIRGVVVNLLGTGQTNILLDLSKVTYLDSAAGIGELVSSYTTALRQGAQLKLLRPGKNVDRVLRVVGLHTIFEIFEDEDLAVRSFEPTESCDRRGQAVSNSVRTRGATRSLP